MRKLILIAGFALASATAQAGEPRSLSLASEAPSVAAPAPAAVAETPKTAEVATPAEAPQATEAPRYVERPALAEPAKTEQPKTDQPKAAQSNVQSGKPVAEKTASRAEKPRHKRYWTESRIIGELHRHGIYW
jgi:hypothetical protein